eukprot:tig00001234_g7751.t1
MEEIMCDWKRSHVLDGLTLTTPGSGYAGLSSMCCLWTLRFWSASGGQRRGGRLTTRFRWRIHKTDDVDCYGARDGSRSGCREAMPYARYVRPSWDSYFMRLAELASQRSNCMKRRVGHRLQRECAGGDGLDECLCLHAEENASWRRGGSGGGGGAVHEPLPCLGCTKKIVQAGVREVVFSAAYAESMDAVSRALLAEAGLALA